MACALIRQVNSEQSIIDHWTFGGGTAMMLQINHRENRDVDIFLSDPQLLPRRPERCIRMNTAVRSDLVLTEREVIDCRAM
jgi:hypothetical protein